MPQTYQKKIRHLATKKNTSKGPAKKYKSKPQNTQTMQKKYQNTPNKTLKYHTQKKTSGNRWLLPSAQARLAHPRLAQTANTAALLQPGMAEDLLKIHSHRRCSFCVHTLIGSNCAIAIAIKLWLWGARLGFQV
jgi:hypothetical protein